MLLELEQNNRQVKILKGAVDTMLKIAHGHVNEAELKWKVQEVSEKRRDTSGSNYQQ